jgi:spore germination protein YaaH
MIENGLPPRQPKQRRRGGGRIALFGVLVTVSLVAVVMWTAEYLRERPNMETVPPDFNGRERPVFAAGTMLEWDAAGSGVELSLPLELLQAHVDPAILYDEKSDSVIITTRDQVIQMQTDQLTAHVNNEPVTLRFPVRREEQQIFVPVQPLLSIYHIDVTETESGAVLLRQPGEIIRWIEVPEADEASKETVKIQVRHAPTIKSPIAWEMEAADRAVLIEETKEGWYRIQSQTGYIGFVDKADVRIAEAETVPKPEREDVFIPWSPLGGKINLTWEAVYSRNPNTQTIPDMPGLNVISPTWFSLKQNDQGGIYIHNMADAAYVDWAHKRGYQVWGLFSNDFDPDLTSRALADFETRMKVIRELLGYAELYDLQGINIDFENVYLKDKDLFTQFVREMTPFLHEQNLVVSIDVTVRGGSEMWSLFADRAALGQVVDYMIVMTYDQHWSSSPKAGSVAELPWTEKGIADIIEFDRVPPEKILLGVPYYTYQWFEEYDAGGKLVKVTSKTLFMKDVEEIIRTKGLEPVFLEDVGQHYVEYEEGGKKVRIWIEDAESMRRRAELVNKLGLAGIASWRRGFETPGIWHVIKETLEKRP